MSAVALPILQELDLGALLDQNGQFFRVPVGQPHAAVGLLAADVGGIRRAVDA